MPSAGCVPWAFSELPAYLRSPVAVHRLLGPVLRRLCRDGHRAGDAHRLGHQGSADVRGRAIGRAGDDHLRQQRRKHGRLHVLGGLHRFPDLKLLYAEAQIGWIPYLLERIDDVWSTHRGWSGSQIFCPEPPSTYYYRQIHSCFFKDAIGVDLLDQVGLENVMFETDYPHNDGTWPHSKRAAAEQFGHLEQSAVDKIARGNAIRLIGLDLPESG